MYYMDNFEADVIDRLGRIETKLDQDHKAIFGNGHPGALADITTLTTRLQALETAVETTQTTEDKHTSMVAVWISILVTAVTSLLSLVKSFWS